METSSKPRPVFIYGTLRVPNLLAWVLTHDFSNITAVQAISRPGKVYGYARYSIHDCDYPAAVKHHNPSSFVDGFLLDLETTSQRQKLDDFEGDQYKAAPVTVVLDTGETVEADMYVWDDDEDALTSLPWDLNWFIRERSALWSEE
ncbi:hypothetical protein FDECE_13896 [Fusarium decemcellulare]|nr:hypothetical protein FDECE_13896 [Fusarium decemcellulare]